MGYAILDRLAESGYHPKRINNGGASPGSLLSGHEQLSSKIFANAATLFNVGFLRPLDQPSCG
jgi:hypothetical protein